MYNEQYYLLKCANSVFKTKYHFKLKDILHGFNTKYVMSPIHSN